MYSRVNPPCPSGQYASVPGSQGVKMIVVSSGQLAGAAGSKPVMMSLAGQGGVKTVSVRGGPGGQQLLALPTQGLAMQQGGAQTMMIGGKPVQVLTGMPGAGPGGKTVQLVSAGQQAGGAGQRLVMAGAGGQVVAVQGGLPGGTMSSVSRGGDGPVASNVELAQMAEESEAQDSCSERGRAAGQVEGEPELIKTEDMLELLEDLAREKESADGPGWGDGYPPLPPGGCMAQIYIGDLNPRLLLTAGSRMSLACLPTGLQERNSTLMILSTTDVGFNITALVPAKDSVAIMGRRRVIMKEYSKHGVENEMEVGVESGHELKLCQWLGRHRLAVLAAGTLSVFARPYTEPVYKLGNNDIVNFDFDSKTQRLFLLNSSGELRSPGSHSSLVKVIDNNIDSFAIRASTGNLFFSDTKGAAWSSRIDTSGACYDFTELDIESTKQVIST